MKGPSFKNPFTHLSVPWSKGTVLIQQGACKDTGYRTYVPSHTMHTVYRSG